MDVVTLSSKFQVVIPQNVRKKLDLKPGQKIVVVEKNGVVHLIPQRAIKHGDRVSPVIGAASILAKVIRDRIMKKYHQLYPLYNFAKNKGYGTREHQEALKQYGYCPLHRKTFRGVIPNQG